ncbi:hypothetical protein Shyhy01_19150 [Streptomyces hygroscopicus subsp. hygroscopicus]|uniref:hypothetical protein n=1 Tax=Streptomyces sp. KHY 26 TaxID=3097359 RepID=UPI0024A4802F|nr:hypothetical protein [Streptomyces hygroscopicus]GLX48965.1 hypothetical protein Shyhy01_19150 [Streptomyces hygroscopicus subsp. hygroscopicus]
MPDPQNTQQMAEALAMTGASTLVAAMATDAWHTGRGGFARLFRRGGNGLREIESQLDNDAVLVSGDDAASARAELIGPWRLRLLRLLRDHPDAAPELTELIDRIRERLPEDGRRWTQDVRAYDRSVVNAVQGGNQYNHYMDRPRPDGDVDEA